MNEKYARHCVKRLSGMPFFPSDKAAVQDLINAFWRQADDEEHAARATDLLVGRQRTCPVPADIADACNETRSVAVDDAWKPNLEPCPECQGTRWRQVIKGRYSAAERCPCGDGKAKRVLEHA